MTHYHAFVGFGLIAAALLGPCENGAGSRTSTTQAAVGSNSAALEGIANELSAHIARDSASPAADKLEDTRAKLRTASAELAKNPPDNQAALGNVEGAVGDLDAAVKEGGIDAATGRSLMDRAAAFSRQLASDAIARSEAKNGMAAKIAKAKGYLAEGDNLRGSGSFKDSVARYRAAVAEADGA